nr:uncharacterized protein LOC111421979 [Onthophagus taurus]
MPVSCAIKNCRSNYVVSTVIGLNISFFNIPKEERVRKLWLMKYKEEVNVTTARVCTLHFRPEDFERDLRAELLQLKRRRLLKKTAIPTLNLGASQDDVSNICEYLDPSTSLLNISKEPLSKGNDVNCLLKSSVARQTEDMITTDDTINELKRKICELAEKNDVLERKLRISTLKSWASKIDMRQGILHHMLLFLSVAGKGYSDQERLVVLSFDEMKVAEVYEYDRKYDQIIGPHSQMQVVNARALFGSWKQPIFAGFDTRMTGTLLLTLINKLHDIGFEVIACVSDCGPSNLGLWRELGITHESSYIVHHTTTKKINFLGMHLTF